MDLESWHLILEKLRGDHAHRPPIGVKIDSVLPVNLHFQGTAVTVADPVRCVGHAAVVGRVVCCLHKALNLVLYRIVREALVAKNLDHRIDSVGC